MSGKNPGFLSQFKVADTTKKDLNQPKPYKEVITAKAVTTNGLIKVHKIGIRYFFEIPDSLLGQDMLIVNRISEGPAGYRQGSFGYAGDEINKAVIQFIKGGNNNIFIRQKDFRERSGDSSQNGLYTAVQNSNLLPIVAAFDIKAFGPDSASTVIDVTDFLNAENDVFFFTTITKKVFKISGAYKSDRSFINSIKSFPLNTEVTATRTYLIDGGYTITFGLNSSIVLLPKDLMKSRYMDDRVGYFAEWYTDFDAQPQRTKLTYVTKRWRLEPKDEDIQKYKIGELVVPKKPIVFYIDPATPQKWVPYLIEGVNAWQKAFEKAGFKNAIYAMEVPKNDSTWSMDDSRHNVIVYKASAVENAIGPSTSDPRTGEILESHVAWFHNVMQLLHDWYMVQAGAIDPAARKMQYDDTLMGKLIRYVCSHEIGHTLGLQHNMLASNTVPVEKLRDKNYVAKYGNTPSIMDYARFNYVAQPEDSININDLIPKIGAYDEWAIEWGYKWLPEIETKTMSEQKKYLFNWINERLEQNKQLWFRDDAAAWFGDPRCQVEELSNDAVAASIYGIKNLKRILPHILDWTNNPEEDSRQDFPRMYDAVIKQYKRYVGHVTSYFGTFYFDPKKPDYKESSMTFVSKDKQKQAIQFFDDEVFSSSLKWLFIDDKLYTYESNWFPEIDMFKFQQSVLNNVLSLQTLYVLDFSTRMYPEKAYNPSDFLNDLKHGVWSEIYKSAKVDLYRRNVQRSYVLQLMRLLSSESSLQLGLDIGLGINLMIRKHIQSLLTDLRKAIPGYKDQLTKEHLQSMADLLQEALSQKNKADWASLTKYTNDETKTIELNFLKTKLKPSETNINGNRWDCWNDEPDFFNEKNK
jgi:hypothetical protein